MAIQQNHGGAWIGRTYEQNDGTPRPATSISAKAVFRQLIDEEVRSGRLTALRRRRIVRFAAGMGLSATEVGRLIQECREEAERRIEATQADHGLRLAFPDGDAARFWHGRLPYMVFAGLLLSVLIHRLIVTWAG